MEIEFPGDRQKSGTQTSSSSVPKTYVKIVKIPCDDTQPYSEVNIPIDRDRPGDQLPELLRVFFREGSVNSTELKAAAAKQFASAEVDLSVSQQTIDRMGSEGAVEVFPLSFPGEHNEQCKVSLYLDEVGQLKRLPANRRAQALASTCGFEGVALAGDMFVARIGPTSAAPPGARARPMALTNLDFSLAELDSGARWLSDIQRHNYQHGVVTNRVAMDGDKGDGAAADDLVAGSSRVDGVTWSQTAEFVEVAVQLPESVQRFTRKDLRVSFQARRLSVELRNTTEGPVSWQGAEVPAGAFLSVWAPATLGGVIRTDDCTWCLNGHVLELTLEKAGSSGRWDCLELS